LFIRNIIEDRSGFVKEILKQAGDTKFIWIGPPNWKKDTGINEMLRNEVGEKRFFSSENLKLARANDGAHPTFSAARVWADSIVHWIQHESKYRFKLEKPPKKMVKIQGFIFLTGK
jgi:lysophospholipase L1-like esterase